MAAAKPDRDRGTFQIDASCGGKRAGMLGAQAERHGKSGSDTLRRSRLRPDHPGKREPAVAIFQLDELARGKAMEKVLRA